MARVLIPFVVLAVMIAAPMARAQTTAAGPWQQGALFSAFVGAARAASDTSAVTGVGLGWEVTDHFGLEGRGAWFHPGTGQSGFAAMLLPRVLFLPSRRANPFVAAGVGMYRASFDTVANAMPEFYRRRVTVASPYGQTFDDFMLVAGGGVDVFASGHLAIRPEVTVQFVMNGSNTRAVPVYGVHLEYHFESHDTRPSVR